MAFARAVNTMGLSLVMSFLGIYVVEGRGYPAWVYGIICLAANLGQSWSNAWAGALSDRIGRRPLITNALFLRSGFIAILGTQVAFDAPLWSLAINIVISSMLRGCFEPVAYALVADVVPHEQRIAAFGLQRMGTNVGWAVGPALGGLLTLFMPYGTIFYLAAAGMIVAAIVTMYVEDPIRRRPATELETAGELRATLRTAFADRVLRLLLLGTFLCALLETQMFSTFSIYMTDKLHLTKADVGWLYTINGIGVVMLQVPALALIRRLGIARTLPWSSLLDALGFALIGLGTGFPGGALAILTLTGAEVMFDPSHQTAIAEVSDPEHRGRTYGLVGFTQTVGIALAPLIGGILLDTLGDHHATMWGLIACFGVGQAWCFQRFVRVRETSVDVGIVHVRSRRHTAS
ncbi:MAG: putative integral rane transport protein [Myxococcales bacterium]|nr:putative integral rane transport protein [Myxococcales bacterium]